MKFGTPDLLFLMGTVLVMYFLFFLPQRKKQKALATMMASLKKGDRVFTSSGIYGEVYSVQDKTVTLKFPDNARIEFDRSAISQIIEEKKAA